MRDIILRLEEANNVVTSEIIKDLIEEHRIQAFKMHTNYLQYKGEVPIKCREFDDESKINNKLANDYRGDIVDGIVGYLFGVPITYEADSLGGETAIQDTIDNFVKMNDIADLDSVTGMMASICGYAARLCYIGLEGEERVMDVPPWECIFVTDGSTDQPQYALRYYNYTLIQNGNKKDVTKVEWYDNENISYFIEDRGQYVPDTITEPAPVVPHLFEYIPLIKFKNNKQDMGDFDKVAALIDSYDRLTSDVQNEVEEFRLAYMIFQGVTPDEETIKAARQTGAFGVDDGQSVSFLTKEMATEFIREHKETLNNNIYKFSKTVDMQAENFAGSGESGEARKWKLLGLENKAITKERKFSSGIRNMFKVIASAWSKKGIAVDYLDITWTFGRNIPVELLHEAQITSTLRGHVSESTRLSLLSFVTDVNAEIELMEQERGITLDDEEEEDDTEQ